MSRAALLQPNQIAAPPSGMRNQQLLRKPLKVGLVERRGNHAHQRRKNGACASRMAVCARSCSFTITFRRTSASHWVKRKHAGASLRRSCRRPLAVSRCAQLQIPGGTSIPGTACARSRAVHLWNRVHSREQHLRIQVRRGFLTCYRACAPAAGGLKNWIESGKAGPKYTSAPGESPLSRETISRSSNCL